MGARNAFVLLGLCFGSGALLASPRDIVIDEIYYNPFSGNEKDEFVEIHNREGTPVDLSGWAFTEGIRFTFPPGASIDPHGYLAVSPSVDRLQARGVRNSIDDYLGRLDNNGEIITLVDDRGRTVSRVHYGDGGSDGGAWPDHADGL